MNHVLLAFLLILNIFSSILHSAEETLDASQAGKRMHITELYKSLQKLLNLETEFIKSEKLKEEDSPSASQWLTDLVEQQTTPQEEFRKKIALKLLTQHSFENPHSYKLVEPIFINTLRELDILTGSHPDHQNLNLAHTINRTQTTVGFMTLSRHLAYQHSCQEIQEQQKLIQLLNNNQRRETLISLLKECSTYEGAFLSFWATTEPGYLDPLSYLLESKEFSPLISALNYSKFACHIKETAILGFSALTPMLLLAGLWWSGTAFFSTSTVKAKLIASAGAAALLSSILDAPLAYESLKLQLTANYLMHKRLNELACLIEKTKNIASILLELGFPEHLVRELYSLSNSDDLQELTVLLESIRSKEDIDIFSYWGKIHVAYRLMEKHKHSFLNAYVTLGYIDFLVSLGDLLYSNKAGMYSIPEFIQDSLSPQLEIEKGWCPLLLKKYEEIVSNTINMGLQEGDISYSLPALIITGPNAQGKTTILRTAGLVVLMAQTLGIVPASRCRLTSLTILTGINIGDNIAEGNSHFQAEAAAAGFIIKNIDSSRFYLLLIDEPFIGTSEQIGSAAAYVYLKRLGRLSNSLLLATSHFIQVTTLQEEHPKTFVNYLVTHDHIFKQGTGVRIKPELYQEVALEILENAIEPSFKMEVAQKIH